MLYGGIEQQNKLKNNVQVMVIKYQKCLIFNNLFFNYINIRTYALTILSPESDELIPAFFRFLKISLEVRLFNTNIIAR